jgi:hypothetical protein
MLLILLPVILTACSQAPPSPTIVPTLPPDPTLEPSPSATPRPTPTLLPEEDPPAGATREFATDFSKHSVHYDEILSGGPGKDGIPAIDEPATVDVETADDWLQPEEPVILVRINGAARAYPIQVLMWHEIVNDTLGGQPVAVTYCPLCNTAIAFDRELDGQVLDFGTTGRLRYSNLVMYDRQTESWWQQALGEAIVGEYTGRQLDMVPAAIVAWEDYEASYPEGDVLSQETGYNRRYGENPYPRYDTRREPSPLYDGPETLDDLLVMARVIGIDRRGETIAYPYAVLGEARVVNDAIGDEPIVVMWAPGTASALGADRVAAGQDVGAGTTYSRVLDGETLTFRFENDAIVDEATGSEWNLLGEAVSGPRAGDQLTPVVGNNFLWFAWAAFHPETEVFQ